MVSTKVPSPSEVTEPAGTPARRPALSVVSTVYRSEQFLPTFIEQTVAAIAAAGIANYEIVFVNDGSPDASRELLLLARRANSSIKLVDLSRNFGHHKAALAGLAHSRGTLVFLIDCDLEVEPATLAQFLAAKQGSDADVVYGIRDERRGPAIERIGGAWFWRLFNWLSDTAVPANVLTERLMTRRYVDALLSLGDRNVFVAGMMYWAGFRQIALTIEKKRRAGRSSYSLRRRIALLVEAVTSFSTAPLKLVLGIGLFTTLCAVVWAIALLIRKLIDPQILMLGYTSLMLAIVGMSGLIITTLGVIGLYVSRIYTQTQNRPLYIVRAFHDRNSP